MDLKNFALIKGENVTIDSGKIKFKPIIKSIRKSTGRSKSPKTIDKESDLQTALLRSDIMFSEGTIEMKIKAGSASVGFLLVFKSQEKNIVVGHSARLKTFCAMDDSMFANPLASAGSLSNYKNKEVINVKIVVTGSQLQFYVNNIFFFQTIVNIKNSPFELRLTSYRDEIEVYDIKTNLSKPKLFIIMQFSKEYNELYEEVIRPVVEDFGFKCVRADEFYTATPILKDIIENIEESKAIIAEITPDNPNVFYEIGYSHAVKKPTILLCDHKREKLPFDISSFRTLFYENTIAGKKKVEDSLKQYLEQIK